MVLNGFRTILVPIGMAIASKSSTASAWTTETVDANLTGGTAISLAGLYSQLLLNSSEKPMCFYRYKRKLAEILLSRGTVGLVIGVGFCN